VGGWWRRTRTVSPIVLAGALLMGEAAALTVLTALHGVGLLRFGSRLPSVLGVIANTSIVDSVSAVVVAGEFALGLVVVVLALRHRGARTR